MNLVLDFGNTRTKAAVFEQSELVEAMSPKNTSETLNFINSYNIIRCIICTVTEEHKHVIKQFSQLINPIVFSSSTPTPLTNLYQSKSSLGSDRLAASVGSYLFYPHKNVLTIDAGTCIKYNFVNAHNEFLGGAISPGLKMRLKALHNFTHALPLLNIKEDYNKLVGENTTESILSGVLLGARAEIDETINEYKNLYKNLTVVLTGGNADFLGKQLKNRFFAHQNILLHGLNGILNYQIEKHF
jgi:type III pantothenate kinase